MSAKEKYIALIGLYEILFVKHQVNSVTMGDIAESAGISKKTLYNYYSNKEAIVVAVIEGKNCFSLLKCFDYGTIAQSNKNVIKTRPSTLKN